MTGPRLIIAILCLAAANSLARDVPAGKAEPKAPADATADIKPGLLKELAAIDARLATIEDLQGRFTQEKHVALLKKPLTSTGQVFVKGTHIRWQVDEPSPTITLTSPGEVRIHYPKDKLVEVYRVDERLSSVVASPLPRLAVLVKHFKIERSPGAKDEKEDGLLRIRLTPRKEELSRHIARVEVTIDIEHALAKRMEIVDADGDRTAISFESLKANRGVKDEQFKLDLPAGTRVVRPLEAAE